MEIADEGMEFINSNFTVDKKDCLQFDEVLSCLDFQEILILCCKNKYQFLSKTDYGKKEYELKLDNNY